MLEFAIVAIYGSSECLHPIMKKGDVTVTIYLFRDHCKSATIADYKRKIYTFICCAPLWRREEDVKSSPFVFK